MYSGSWGDVVLYQKFWALCTDLEMSAWKGRQLMIAQFYLPLPLSHMSLGRQAILPVRMCRGKIYLGEVVGIEETNLVV